MKSSKKTRTSHADRAILRSAYSGFCWIPPCRVASFEVNSEPHTGARPSVRLCVGLMTSREIAHMQVGQCGNQDAHAEFLCRRRRAARAIASRVNLPQYRFGCY